MRNLTLLFVCAILSPQLWPTASGFSAIEGVSDLGAASPFLVWNDYWQSLFSDDDDAGDDNNEPPSNHTKEDHTGNATSSDVHWMGLEKIVGSVKESVAEIEKSASGILKVLSQYVQQLQSNGTTITTPANATQIKAPTNATDSMLAN